jgi:hypothetical protein
MGPFTDAGPLKAMGFLVFAFPFVSVKVRPNPGDDDMYRLARFLWLTEVWAIMVGSALGLAAAIIQLVLAYQ